MPRSLREQYESFRTNNDSTSSIKNVNVIEGVINTRVRQTQLKAIISCGKL